MIVRDITNDLCNKKIGQKTDNEKQKRAESKKA